MRILLPVAICMGLVLGHAAVAQQPTIGSLSVLRADALAAVNRDRLAHGLAPLVLDDKLDAAAQAHAEDMWSRRYFDHFSPEGRDVGDRYRSAGGSEWNLVEENIADCNGCPALSNKARINYFEQAWMDSPYHRENVLHRGVTAFGFGIVGIEGQSVVAVQTFSGPGEPRGTAGETVRLTPAAQLERVLARINARRRSAGLAPLRSGAGLSDIARGLVSNDPDDIVDLRATAEMETLLPPADRNRYADIQVLGSRCGGCGGQPTAADIDFFADYWLDQDGMRQTVLTRSLDSLGFTVLADGKGMKSAVLVLAQQH